jgi:sn-glycerol 3-phosphate transport system permease protein
MKTRNREKKAAIKGQIICIIVVLLFAYPFLYMVSTSFKTLNEIFNSGLGLLPKHPTVENYVKVFTTLPVMSYIRNSLIIALLAMVFKITTSVLASYALVFMDFKGKNVLFYFFTMTMFIPFTVIILPNYLTINRMHLLNTLVGVALPQLADAMGIFRIRQAMKQVPKSLVEAARLDNVPHFTTMTRIVIPLVRPAISAMAIYFFIGSWNEYFWPLLILRNNTMSTVTLALQQFTSGESGSAWGSSMALATIATAIPLTLYLIFQKYIIGTFMSSGIKE